LCLLTTAAHATVIEIPLPGLLGNYPVGPGNATRTVTFQLPQIPDSIHGASFRIVGTTTIGLADCGEVGMLDKWPMEFIAQMTDAPDQYWLAWEAPSFTPGTFTSTAEFEPIPETTTWGFLMDGEADINLFGAPSSALGLCNEVLLPTGSITEAVLIIDAAFPFAVEPSTWGRIKALYRAQ